MDVRCGLVNGDQPLSPARLRAAAFERIAGISANARLVRDETKIVNGLNVVYLELALDDSRQLVGYFFTGAHGTFQLAVWAERATLEANREAIQSLLEGVVTINPYSHPVD